MNTLTRTTCALGLLVTFAGAHADYTGLSATYRNVTTSAGLELTVYRLYANFDSPTDRLAGLGGTFLTFQTLDSGGGGFFHEPLFGTHQNQPVSAGAVAAFPDLAYDTYLTLNVPAGWEGEPTLALPSGHFYEGFAGTFFNPPNGETGFSTDQVVQNDAGWYLLPTVIETLVRPFPPVNSAAPTGDGVYDGLLGVGGDYAVLVGQFTVLAGNTFSGDLGVLSAEIDGASATISGPSVVFSFGVPSACPADLDGNGDVGFSDILQIIGAWGACEGACAEDLNGNGSVDFADILVVIGGFGACPTS
ncbi:MAG: hypothetical protein ACYTGP_09005 [Planctomycetota bacterium]|jgi:hypothetical protein